MTDAPERVWLDPDDMPSEHDKQFGADVEYIRRDIHAAVLAERDALAARVAKLEEAGDRLADAAENGTDLLSALDAWDAATGKTEGRT